MCIFMCVQEVARYRDREREKVKKDASHESMDEAGDHFIGIFFGRSRVTRWLESK